MMDIDFDEFDELIKKAEKDREFLLNDMLEKRLKNLNSSSYKKSERNQIIQETKIEENEIMVGSNKMNFKVENIHIIDSELPTNVELFKTYSNFKRVTNHEEANRYEIRGSHPDHQGCCKELVKTKNEFIKGFPRRTVRSCSVCDKNEKLVFTCIGCDWDICKRCFANGGTRFKVYFRNFTIEEANESYEETRNKLMGPERFDNLLNEHRKGLSTALSEKPIHYSHPHPLEVSGTYFMKGYMRSNYPYIGCDICHSTGSSKYFCEKCDWDICETCFDINSSASIDETK
jgi:uncharacterized membrane protein